MSNLCVLSLSSTLCLLMASGTALAESVVVLSARGIALKPGEILDSNKPLPLKQGQHVTLISVSGETIKLDGPFSGPPVQQIQTTAKRSALAVLISESGMRTNAVGTTRAGAPLAALPDPWLIDVSHGGHACLLEGKPPVFWRPDAKTEGNVTLMPDDRSWKVSVQWPAGLERLVLNKEIIVRAGVSYFVTFNGTESAIRIEEVPLALENEAMRAAWMANRSCDAQATALARMLK